MHAVEDTDARGGKNIHTYIHTYIQYFVRYSQSLIHHIVPSGSVHCGFHITSLMLPLSHFAGVSFLRGRDC